MKDKGFRQIDNEYYLAILAADLTRAGTKVLLVVIHFTLGYDQRDTAEISLTTFQNLTKLSRPAVKTAIRELIAYGLIAEVGSATNRLSTIYKLNKDWRGKVDLPSGGKVDLPSGDAKTYPPDVENLPSRGQVRTPATVPLKKERKPLKKTRSARKERVTPEPLVTLILSEMKAYLGYTGKPGEKDPIPSYGKEGQAIKRMLARGFSHDEILNCWKGKVAERGGDFVSMTWVNEDIGKKAGSGAHKQRPRQLPKTYRSPEEIFRDQDRARESYTRPEDY